MEDGQKEIAKLKMIAQLYHTSVHRFLMLLQQVIYYVENYFVEYNFYFQIQFSNLLCKGANFMKEKKLGRYGR